ncbi:MAG: tRNA lysidine(34) synthetase TilS [Firmicutes bacterium]|nr:tRNA lysidine(34) synthetase TilS [Bacillota bacterium]
MFDIAMNTVSEHKLLDAGDRIILGVSGGADSCALLHFLCALRTDFSLELFVMHLNHGIRGESAARDEAFVRELCKRLKVDFYPRFADVPALAKASGESLEEAGRNARRKELFELKAELSADKIALGHNLEDNAETLLLRMARGTGLLGLLGIPPQTGAIIRPLIDCPRSKIEDYCRKNSIDFCTDETNLGTEFARNKVRHEILPALFGINRSAVKNISKLCSLLREDEAFLASESEAAFLRLKNKRADIGNTEKSNVEKENIEKLRRKTAGELSLPAGELLELPFALRSRVIRLAAKEAASLRDISSAHIKSIEALCSLGTGHSADLPGGLSCRMEYGSLIFAKSFEKGISKEEPFSKEELFSKKIPADFCAELVPGEKIFFPGQGFGVNLSLKKENSEINKNYLYTKTFDYDKIKGKLCLRGRKAGDKMPIKDGTKHKSIKKLFIDEKVPADLREAVPLVVCGEDSVVWAAGVRASDYYLAKNDTTDILEISFEFELRKEDEDV